LWEPLIDEYRADQRRLQFRWVKGHGLDQYNDLVDRLAVAAATDQRGGEGDSPPALSSLGAADQPSRVGPRSASPPASPAPSRRASPAASPAPSPQLRLAGGPAPSQVVLRSARETDAEAVLALWRAAGARPSRTDSAADVRALVALDPEALVLADAGGEVVASVIAAFDGWRGALYRLAVRPDMRRRGLGSALVGEAERRLRARGARRAGAIVVHGDEGATAFWEALGYQHEAEVARHVKNFDLSP